MGQGGQGGQGGRLNLAAKSSATAKCSTAECSCPSVEGGGPAALPPLVDSRCEHTVSPPSMPQVGLDGSNQTVGMGDSGVRVDQCYFEDRCVAGGWAEGVRCLRIQLSRPVLHSQAKCTAKRTASSPST